MPEIELRIKSRDLDTLINLIRETVPEPDLELVKKAYEYAYVSHREQSRLSGEPYIIHPLEVSMILAGLGIDTTTIAAAMLHDIVEDTGVSLDNITEIFGNDIANLVDGVTKISSLKKKSKSIEQAQNLRKMLLATIRDVRVILIKLADKLHNMRTIMFQPEGKQRMISKETLDIYAPLAARLGMSKIRSELEDLAFHVLHHDEYHEIASMVVQRKYEIENFIDDIRSVLHKKINEMNINAEITGRVKHYYSIFRKMKFQGKSFDDIFDIRAIRIITKETKDCYGILGIIHAIWTPIGSRFKDFIAVPKSNMYQSLHTTVIGPGGHHLEIQIRTYEMHSIAEMGIAAHWMYKDEHGKNRKGYSKITLLNSLNKWHSEMIDTREFMKELKMDLYEDEIFVFTPKGKIITLAKGSTPVDFAYSIHTEVGNHCVGSKVNNNMVPLKTELKSGDIIDIRTSPRGHPSESWMKFVKSSNARYKIKNWLNKNTGQSRDGDEKEEPRKPDKTAEMSIPDNELIKLKKASGQKKIGISIDGTSNVLIKLSQCCQPIPGDQVIGFITRGRGVTVHKKNCPSLKRLKVEKERMIHIRWEGSAGTFPVKLAIVAIDRQNLLRDMADAISQLKTNILKMDAQVKEKDKAEFRLILEVKNLEHMNEIIARLKKIRNVTDVFKINEKVVIK